MDIYNIITEIPHITQLPISEAIFRGAKKSILGSSFVNFLEGYEKAIKPIVKIKPTKFHHKN